MFTIQDSILIALALATAVVVIFLVMQYKASINARKPYSTTIYKKGYKRKEKNGKSKLMSVYKFFQKFPPTTHFTARVTKQYSLIYPGDLKTIREKSAIYLLRTYLISAAALILVVALRASTYLIIVTIIIVFIGNSLMLQMKLDSGQLVLLEEFSSFIDSVRHYYFDCGMVEESIFQALDEVKPTVKAHAEKIYEIVTADDFIEAVQKYDYYVPNRFIKSFVALCIISIQYGDTKVNGVSSFIDNIKYLKKDIYIEILKRRKLKHAMAGATFTIVAPIFALDAIKSWAIANFSTLDSFYNGTRGYVVSIILLLITIGAYTVLSHIRELEPDRNSDHYILEWISGLAPVKKLLDNYVNARYAKMLKLEDTLKRVGESLTVRLFILKRVLFGTAITIGFIISFIIIHSSTRTRLITTVTNADMVANGATEEDTVFLREAILFYTPLYRYNTVVDEDGVVVSEDSSLFSMHAPSPLVTKTGLPYVPSGDVSVMANGTLNVATMTDIIKADKELKSDTVCADTAEEIIRRITQYQNEYLKWYEVLIAILCGFAAFYYHYIVLLAKKKSLQKQMEDEVIQFEAIITMLAPIRRMTIDTVIEWMEEFGVIFKSSLTACMNSLNAGDIDALEKLIEDEPFEMFDRVIENLKISDRIGIQKAFNDVEVERANYQDKRRQENEIDIDNKGAIASFISMIPMGAILMLYLIYPIVVEGFTQLMSSMSEMSAM